MEPGTPGPIGGDDETPVDGAGADDFSRIRSQANLERQLTLLTSTLGDLQSELRQLPPDSGERLSRVERAVKWATPWRSLLALILFLVTGAVGVLMAIRGYAETTIIETVQAAHKDGLEPSVPTIEEMKERLETTSEGVEGLLLDRERQKTIRALEFELKLHEEQYAQRLQEWNARRAARRRAGEKPEKTPEHLALEAALRATLQD